eukprot:Tbor_TRINITY_DN5998_c3_g1::TRINITY_DN5998_c3_g1_i7::g.18173::m.18173
MLDGDHFVLDENVRIFFQFVPRRSIRRRLKLLPMGFRPSAAVAQSATYKLLNFRKTSEIASCIDNMGLANDSKERLIEDAMKVVNRVTQVNFTLNDLPSPAGWKDMEDTEKQKTHQKADSNRV